MVDALGIHGTDETDLVRNPSGVRQLITERSTSLSMLGEVEGGADQRD